MLALALLLPAVLSAQVGPLPEEVREWMERDQARRWAALLATGETLFSGNSCVRCHGEGGEGSARGPDLTDDQWTHGDGSLPSIRYTIFWGVRPDEISEEYRLPMNPAGGLHLQPVEYDALAAYVWSLSRGADGGS